MNPGSDRSMLYRVAVIPGDGVGAEVVPLAGRLLRTVLGDRLQLVELPAGFELFERTGESLPEATLNELKRCDGALFGASGSPAKRLDGYRSPILTMRRELGLFANIRPLRSSGSVSATDRDDVDIVIVRENTEGLYVGRERLEDDGETAIAERVITRQATTRIAEKAFLLARERQGTHPSRVTVVHKANVLRLSDGLFLETALDVASKFPDIEVEEQLVDSMVYRLILEPERYDVVLAPNLYGDILSDAGAALVGGLGLAASANLSDSFCLAEPVHGSAPDIAGKGIANPVATFRAAALLLRHLKLLDEATAIEGAVDRVLAAGPRTPDLGGKATTVEVAEAVFSAVNL